MQILFIGSRLLLLRNPILGWHGGAIALTTVLYTFCYSGIAAALGTLFHISRFIRV